MDSTEGLCSESISNLQKSEKWGVLGRPLMKEDVQMINENGNVFKFFFF